MSEADVPEIRYLGYSGLLKHGAKFDPQEIQSKWPKSPGRRGAFGFFLKPFNVEQLIDHIGRAFKRYEVRKHKAK